MFFGSDNAFPLLLHLITPSFNVPDHPVPYDISSTSNSAVPLRGLSPYTTPYAYVALGSFLVADRRSCDSWKVGEPLQCLQDTSEQILTSMCVEQTGR